MIMDTIDGDTLITDDLVAEHVTEAVAAGVTWLDETIEDWRVIIRRGFNMCGGGDCILAQVVGMSYWSALSVLGKDDEWASRHGFTMPERMDGGRSWDQLQMAWEDAADLPDARRAAGQSDDDDGYCECEMCATEY